MKPITMRLESGTGDKLVPSVSKNIRSVYKVTHYMTNYVPIGDTRYKKPANRNHYPRNGSTLIQMIHTISIEIININSIAT
jgi:hypothetical protein